MLCYSMRNGCDRMTCGWPQTSRVLSSKLPNTDALRRHWMPNNVWYASSVSLEKLIDYEIFYSNNLLQMIDNMMCVWLGFMQIHLSVRSHSHIYEYKYKSKCISTRKHEIQGILVWSVHAETSSARVRVACDSYLYESSLHESCFRQFIQVLFVYIVVRCVT